MATAVEESHVVREAPADTPVNPTTFEPVTRTRRQVVATIIAETNCNPLLALITLWWVQQLVQEIRQAAGPTVVIRAWRRLLPTYKLFNQLAPHDAKVEQGSAFDAVQGFVLDRSRGEMTLTHFDAFTARRWECHSGIEHHAGVMKVSC